MILDQSRKMSTQRQFDKLWKLNFLVNSILYNIEIDKRANNGLIYYFQGHSVRLCPESIYNPVFLPECILSLSADCQNFPFSFFKFHLKIPLTKYLSLQQLQ